MKLIGKPFAILQSVVIASLSSLWSSGVHSGETINIPGAFGDKEGCYFHRTGEVRTDTGQFIDSNRTWSYEGGCSLSDVENVTEMFSVSSLRNAWSVKLICQTEDETFTKDAIIRHDVLDGARETVTISYGVGDTTVLEPCN